MKTLLSKAAGRRQRGAALFIALIALVFMMLAGIAMVRSVDTSNVIAGNLTFRQASLSVADVATETAFTAMNHPTSGFVITTIDANSPAGCSGATSPPCSYFALRLPEKCQDSSETNYSTACAGVPSGLPKDYASSTTAVSAPNGVDWSKVLCRYGGSSVPAGCATGSSTVAGVPSGYYFQYVVDRLCIGALPVTDIQGNCLAGQPSQGGTKKAGGIKFTSSQEVYYRATVRVTGPRGTSSMIQTIFAR